MRSNTGSHRALPQSAPAECTYIGLLQAAISKKEEKCSDWMAKPLW